MSAALNIKGWCPGALRPMESGDGLIARVRPHLARLTAEQLVAIADAAEAFGNGSVDLTRRANLQIRGATREGLPALQAHLDQAGLLDDTEGAEARRNILVSPLLGIDVTCGDLLDAARSIEETLANNEAFRALPTKFGFALDAGGILTLGEDRSDVRLVADGPSVALYAASHYVGHCPTAEAADAALALAHFFLAERRDDERRLRAYVSRVGIATVRTALEHHVRLGTEPQKKSKSAPRIGYREDHRFISIGFPFGEANSDQLRFIADIASSQGRELRVTPWRALIVSGIGPQDAVRALARARDLDLIVDGDDLRLSVVACPGGPACGSGEAPTRSFALELLGQGVRMKPGSLLHVSGCQKGCAHSGDTAAAVTASEGRYRVGFDVSASDVGGPLVDASGVHQQLLADKTMIVEAVS
jgi:precorrin-3B synthase